MNSHSRRSRLERSTGHAVEMNQNENRHVCAELRLNAINSKERHTEIFDWKARSGDVDMWSLKFKVIKFIAKTWSYLNFYKTTARARSRKVSFDCLKQFHFLLFYFHFSISHSLCMLHQWWWLKRHAAHCEL